MNIAIFTHNYPESKTDRKNAGIFVHDMASEIAKSENVFVVAPGEINKTEKMEGVTVQRFKGSGKKLGHLNAKNPADIISLLGFIKEGIKASDQTFSKDKPNFTVAMWAFPGGLFAYYLKKRHNIPYAVWALGSDIYIYAKLPILGTLIKQILKNANKLYADGFDLCQEVKKLSGKKCEFLPSASRFRKAKGIQKKQKDGLKLAFLGRMEPVKGPDIFLSALIQAKNKVGNFHVDFMGDGSLLEQLKKESEKVGLRTYFTFHGNVSDPEKISRMISAADWLVIPSRSDSIPLVFAESMKCKTPIIASDLPDLEFLINKYKVGYTFKMGKPGELAMIIKSLPQKRRERERFALNTAIVAKEFSVEESAKKLVKYIKEAI